MMKMIPMEEYNFPQLEEENDELYEHYSFTADKGQQPLRVDKYLMNFIEGATRNKIHQAAKDGNIYVNDSPVKSNYKVRPKDEISIVLPYPVREIKLIPEDILIDIIYEDDQMVMVNKPANMVVHPGFGNYSGTLLNALVYHFDSLPKINNP